MAFFRRKRHVPEEPRVGVTGPATATVDPRAWRLLTEHVLAASAGDVAAWVQVGRRAAAESLPMQRLVGLYVIHLLKHRLWQIHGEVPTAEDLVVLTKRAYPRYSAVMNAGSGTLRDTLLTTFKLLPRDQEVTGARYTISALAALGVLTPASETELDGMQRYLADWCARDSSGIAEVINAEPQSPEPDR